MEILNTKQEISSKYWDLFITIITATLNLTLHLRLYMHIANAFIVQLTAHLKTKFK